MHDCTIVVTPLNLVPDRERFQSLPSAGSWRRPLLLRARTIRPRNRRGAHMNRITRSFALTAVAVLAAGVAAATGAPAAHAASPVSLTSGFYIDPNSSPTQWVAAHPSDGRSPAINSSRSEEHTSE